MNKYNIGLVFNEEYDKLITDYATKLYSSIDSDIKLGVNFTPHVTISQFELDPSLIEKVWNKFSKISLSAPKITLAGLTILPSSNGGAWIEVQVLKSLELLNIQNSLIEVLSPYCDPTSAVGDKYRPHITLAHMKSGDSISDLHLDYASLREKNLKTELDIGLGINFGSIDLPK